MFGIGAPYQSRMGPLGARLAQPMQQQQPQRPMDLAGVGSLPGMGDVRSGLSKLGIGSPAAPAAAPPMAGMPASMPSPAPYDPSAMMTGLPPAAAAGAAEAAAPAVAEGAEAAGAAGFDISAILAMIGL